MTNMALKDMALTNATKSNLSSNWSWLSGRLCFCSVAQFILGIHYDNGPRSLWNKGMPMKHHRWSGVCRFLRTRGRIETQSWQICELGVYKREGHSTCPHTAKSFQIASLGKWNDLKRILVKLNIPNLMNKCTGKKAGRKIDSPFEILWGYAEQASVWCYTWSNSWSTSA